MAKRFATLCPMELLKVFPDRLLPERKAAARFYQEAKEERGIRGYLRTLECVVYFKDKAADLLHLLSQVVRKILSRDRVMS